MSREVVAARFGVAILATITGCCLAFALIFSGNSAIARAILRNAERVRPAGIHQVVLQRNGYDCGPAAVANLLALIHRSDGLDALESELAPTALGTPIDAMAAALRRRGIPARVIHTTAARFRTLRFPLIALTRHHFVVVAQDLPKAQVEIMDPALGDLLQSRATFANEWSGWAITI